MQTQNVSPHAHWQGRWPGGLDPYANALNAKARALWGEEDAAQDLQMSFFVDGTRGAAWVVNLEWTGVVDRLGSMKVLHLGGYLP